MFIMQRGENRAEWDKKKGCLAYLFRLANYHIPYPLDISDKTGGILVYIKSNEDV